MSTSSGELLRQVKSEISEIDPSEVNELLREGAVIVLRSPARSQARPTLLP
jgi:hypothetical protein